MSSPTREVIPRTSPRTMPDQPLGGPADWVDLERQLVAGEATTWLSLPTERGVHTRPVLAAWTGDAFVVSTNPDAVKTGHLDRAARCSLAVGLGGAHLVVEARPARLTGSADLEEAVAVFDRVFGWPTWVDGDHLDAEYAAPSSGRPPFRVYELTPLRAHAFPTDDGFEPTRFRFA